MERGCLEGIRSGAPRAAGLLRLRREEGGAAAVVSILLSILVILTLLTLVTTVWMPDWMEEIESDHMKDVNSQFGDLKSTIDKQILKGDTAFVIATPITLGAKGFSIFGSDAEGTVSINSFQGDYFEYSCNLRNESGAINMTATGGMKYESHNQHYVDRQLSYENGAIILDQDKAELVRIGPQFTIERFGPVNSVKFVLITVSGTDTSLRGTGTVLVQTKLMTYTTQTHIFDSGEWLNLTMTTTYPEAWARYYNDTFLQAGLNSSTDYVITVGENRVDIDISNVQFLDLGFALVSAKIEEAHGSSATPAGLAGTVGIWHMNEGTGATTRDSSDNGLNGALAGADWTGGVLGGGLEFDGINDIVTVPDAAALNFVDAVTVSAWVRWDVDPSTGDAYANVVSKGENQWQLQHCGNTTGSPWRNAYFEFAVETATNRTWVWSHTEVAVGQWYHVVGTYDSATEALSIYVNGTLENSTSLNGSINLGGRDLIFGARPTAGAEDRYFEGDVDEVMVFERALTPTEISRIYSSQRP